MGQPSTGYVVYQTTQETDDQGEEILVLHVDPVIAGRIYPPDCVALSASDACAELDTVGARCACKDASGQPVIPCSGSVVAQDPTPSGTTPLPPPPPPEIRPLVNLVVMLPPPPGRWWIVLALLAIAALAVAVWLMWRLVR
jgi:hypothetical protein